MQLAKDATAADVHTNSASGDDKKKKKPKVNGGEVTMKADEADFSVSLPVSKLDDDLRMVWGWASVVEEGGVIVTDTQGDQIDIADLSKAARDFMNFSRLGGDMHSVMGVGTVVESIVFTPELQKALGVDLGKVGWFVGFHVTDDKVWKRVKNGELQAFSFGGRARREDVNAN